MAGFRLLADGRIKLTALTVKPTDPAAPTAAEITATTGFELTMKVLQDGFNFGAADSDKISEKALGSVGNAQTLGASNFVCNFTMWRWFTTGNAFDSGTGGDDLAFQAFKTKGTTLWLYGRQNGKLATAAWAATDEFFFGCEIVTDGPQRVESGGFIKYRIPTEVQNGYQFGTIAA